MPKFVFLHHCYITLRSRSKIGSRSKVKVTGSRSNFWYAAVDIRGSALPSAAMSNNHHYQSKVIVCMSVISGHLRVTMRMWSIGFLLFIYFLIRKLSWTLKTFVTSTPLHSNPVANHISFGLVVDKKGRTDYKDSCTP